MENYIYLKHYRILKNSGNKYKAQIRYFDGLFSFLPFWFTLGYKFPEREATFDSFEDAKRFALKYLNMNEKWNIVKC